MNIHTGYDPITFGIQIGCALLVITGLIALIRLFVSERKTKKSKVAEPRRIEMDIDMSAVYVINGKWWRVSEYTIHTAGIHNEERMVVTLDWIGK